MPLLLLAVIGGSKNHCAVHNEGSLFFPMTARGHNFTEEKRFEIKNNKMWRKRRSSN